MSENTIRFKAFTPALAHHFGDINRQWIEDMFVLEDVDKRVLDDPQTHIINKGGMIWFAQHPSIGIVGTCALQNKSTESDMSTFELTKMGVLSSARGLKVGELLLQYVIQQANLLKIQRLFLLTNSKCEAAIHLYEKNGFEHSHGIMQEFGGSYERCNVAMLLNTKK